MAQRMHLNTLLDIMIMMLLDHYVLDFHKWLVMLKNLMKMQQCLLKLTITAFKKITIKYGKKLKSY